MTQNQVIRQCLRMIEEKSCLGNSSKWAQRDYSKLSDLITNETQINLSVSTLRRIWSTNSTFKPQTTTLDALAQYIGFTDWHDYYSQHDQFKKDGSRLLIFLNKFRSIPIKILIPYLALILVISTSLLYFINLNNRDDINFISSKTKENNAISPPKMVIDSFLRCISFPRNGHIIPSRLKTFFLEDASITMRRRDTIITRYNTNSYIESILEFSNKDYIKRLGYLAYANSTWDFEYRDIAHVYVHFHGKLYGLEELGFNHFLSFHLLRVGNSWKISSIIGENIDENIELPNFMK